jgi:hypothetical protein
MGGVRHHDLLDCPFCGGRPALEFDEDACLVTVACKACDMGRDMGWNRSDERTRAKAVKALKEMWNYRT